VRLGFEHPGDGEWAEYESTYPEDLQRALDTVREESA
jgi:23S rRNA pseudouridine1911/1915/1917 synthase